MNAEIRPEQAAEDVLQPITAADYVAGIETYLADAERDHVLRPHQDVMFHDVQDFLREGGTKGYVTAPTGTGKTVVFVELSKALLEASNTAGRTPKILVVEPTKNLVTQTLGRTGKKGYGKFAPGLQIASFFSESIAEDKLHLNRADVVVTTYDSLSIMTRRDEVRDQTEKEKDEQLYQILDEVIENSGSETAYLYQQLENLGFLIKK